MSLRALSISGSIRLTLEQLCTALPRLVNLEFFFLKTQYHFRSELAVLLMALRCCPLTQLALESTRLGASLCEE